VLAPLKGSFVHVVQPLFIQLGRGILTLPGRRGLVETVRGLRTLLYLAKLDPQVFCGMIEEDMWEIIIAAMPESKDMYFSVAAEFLELGVGCGVFERQELISRKAMELIEACDPKRVVMYRKFILALRRADDGSPFGQWLEASEQWSAVDAILQAIEEEEEKNKIPIRTAAEARQLRFEKLAQPRLPDAPPPPPKPVSADTRRAPGLGVSLADHVPSPADGTDGPTLPQVAVANGAERAGPGAAAAVHLAEAGPGAADGYQGVAVDLTSPPNADAPEHAAFPPAFPPAPDAGGSTVIDSPLVVRE